MKSQPVKLTYQIDLQPGELLALPPELTASIGAGRWLAFLNSYAPEDEGLYDDYTR